MERQCPYKDQCVRYGKERIVCERLYFVCYYKRRIDEVHQHQKDITKKINETLTTKNKSLDTEI